MVDGEVLYWLDEGAGKLRRRLGDGLESSLLVQQKAGGSPVAMETPGLTGEDIAVDEQNLYWNKIVVDVSVGSIGLSLESSPKAGGESTSLATFGDGWIGPIIVGTNLAVARSDGIWLVPKDGSGAQLLADGPFEPRAITTDGTTIAVLEATRVVTVDLAGTVTTLACGDNRQVSGLGIDASRVYWTDIATSNVFEAER